MCPGSAPRSPLIVVAPVFVIVDPASTAKFAAVPSGTGDVAALAPDGIPMSAAVVTASAEPRASQRNQGALWEPRARAAFVRPLFTDFGIALPPSRRVPSLAIDYPELLLLYT